MIDLCIWTLNSGKTLRRCLESVERAIPEESRHCKIAVDGGSKDDTRAILEEFGWQIIDSPPGIPRQANLALSRVDTEVFASFEHDIVLPSDWIRILENLGDEKTAVVTGLRRWTGGKALLSIQDYADMRNRGSWNHSIDNTIYRTGVLRRLGGFPTECPLSADTLLLRKVMGSGYRWRVDRRMMSLHIRSSLVSSVRHEIKQRIRARYVWRWKKWGFRKGPPRVLTVILSPITGARVGVTYRTIAPLFAYPFLRFTQELVMLFERDKVRWIEYDPEVGLKE